MKLAYNGSHEIVDVPALGRTVVRGEPVEIERHGLVRQLVRQGWIEPNEDNTNDNGKGDS